MQWSTIVHTEAAFGTIQRKGRIGDTIRKIQKPMGNVIAVDRDAAQTLIVVVWNVVPTIAAGGNMENARY